MNPIRGYSLLLFLALLPRAARAQEWKPESEALKILRFQGSRALDLIQLRRSDGWLSGQPLYQGMWLRESGASDSVVFDFLPFASAPRGRDGLALAFDQGTGSRMWTGFTDEKPGRSALLGAAAQGLLRVWGLISPKVASPRPLINRSQCPGMRLRLGQEALQGFGTDGRDVPLDTRAFIVYADCRRDLGSSWYLEGGLRGYDWRTPGMPDRQDLETAVRIARLPPGEGFRIFADASWTPEYQRLVLHLERPLRVRGLRVRPLVRVAWGEGLPFGLGFWPGGLDGFPGFKSGEARGNREFTAGVDLIQPLVGNLSLRTFVAAGRTAIRGPVLPGAPWLAGVRSGLNLNTRFGLIRFEYGMAGGSHRALLIRLGNLF